MGSDRTLGAARCPTSPGVRTAILLLVLAWPHVGEAAPNESADELLKRSISLATSGRLEDAEQLLTEGKSVYERDARFPIELAGVAWRKKQSTRAKQYLRQGLRLDPAGAYAIEFLGSLYLLDAKSVRCPEVLESYTPADAQRGYLHSGTTAQTRVA